MRTNQKRKPVKVLSLQRLDAEGEELEPMELSDDDFKGLVKHVVRDVLITLSAGLMLETAGRIMDFDADPVFILENLSELQREMLQVMQPGRDFSGLSEADLGVALEAAYGVMKQTMERQNQAYGEEGYGYEDYGSYGINEGAYSQPAQVGQRSYPANYSPSQVGALLDRFNAAEEQAFHDAAAGGDFGHAARMPEFPSPRIV